MAQSPALEIVRIKNVAGTFAMITWDDLGGVFNYEVQKSANSGQFIAAGITSSSEYFDQDVTPNTLYVTGYVQYRLNIHQVIGLYQNHSPHLQVIHMW